MVVMVHVVYHQISAHTIHISPETDLTSKVIMLVLHLPVFTPEEAQRAKRCGIFLSTEE